MLSRVLYYLSFVVITVTIAIFGMRIWRTAHQRMAALPAWVALVPDGTLELASDRHTLRRSGVTAWQRETGVAFDLVELLEDGTVVGYTNREARGFASDAGAPALAFTLPADEHWMPARIRRVGGCRIVVTQRGGDAILRCLATQADEVRWTATIVGGRECRRAPVSVPGGVVMVCAGWTAVIDDQNGSTSIDAGGLSMVSLTPPVLLRADPYLQLAPWDPATKTFSHASGEIAGLAEFLAASAVLYGDQLLVRAASGSTNLAVVADRRGGGAHVIAASSFSLADDAPLVTDCGGGAPPRFQLVRLRPLASTTAPSATPESALGMLDAESGELVWTSTPFHPLTAGLSEAPLCVARNYFVAIDVAGSDGSATSLLWVVDADRGTTTTVLAAAPGTSRSPSFSGLTRDQVDVARLVFIAGDGARTTSWRTAAAETPGARANLETVIGRLP